MSETVYYEQDGVIVTNARFIANARTYPLGQISSVKLDHKPATASCAARVLILVGIVFLLTGLLMTIVFWPASRDWAASREYLAISLYFVGIWLVADVFALGILVWGIVLAIKKKPTYTVQVTIAAGEVAALKSHEADVPTSVVEALNQALADRG